VTAKSIKITWICQSIWLNILQTRT